jgi:hypothetical protein
MIFCQCCKPPCVFFSDAAPSDDDDWDDVSGILIANHTNPQHDLGTKYTFTAEPDTTTDTIYFYCDWVDASNHHRVSLVSNGTTLGTLRIHKVTGGTPTQVGTNLTVTGWDGDGTITIEVCFNPPASIVATVGGFQRAVASDHHGGEEFGIGGDATFTDFSAQVLREDCDDCSQVVSSCNSCATDTVPAFLAVKLTGVVSDRCDAANLNDKWFIITRGNCATSTVAFCGGGDTETTDTQVQFYPFATMPPATQNACDPTTGPSGFTINFLGISVILYRQSGTDNWRITVAVITQETSSTAQQPTWRGTWITQEAAPDCLTIEGVELPFVCDGTFAANSDESYDFTNSTATVSVP